MIEQNILNDEKDPRTLYHYTTIGGLIGIVEEKKLWVTNINHLNDKKEFITARDIFKERIGEEFGKPMGQGRSEAYANSPSQPPDPKTSTFDAYQIALHALEQFSQKVYVFSLSRHGDQLSQWRGYCSSGGFNIGFNVSELRTKVGMKGRLEECIYRREAQETRIGGIIEAGKSSGETGGKLLMSLVKDMMKLAPLCKDDSFHEEKEWRLVLLNGESEPIKFREGKSAIIPYCEIDLGQDRWESLIDSITIGPTLNPDASALSLEILLEKHHIPSEKIMKSAIPYRPL